jgi:hypothetical protein
VGTPPYGPCKAGGDGPGNMNTKVDASSIMRVVEAHVSAGANVHELNSQFGLAPYMLRA